MVTRTVKYALSVLRVLAESPGERVLGRDIARVAGIPPHYVSKILSRLQKAGFVESQKGWGGGFVLTKWGARRPLADVWRLFDARWDEGACVFGLKRCNASRPCPLHSRWAGIRGAFEQMLADTPVAQLGG